MSGVLTNISLLQAARQDIATAISNKGGFVHDGDGFSDFAADIGTITTSGSEPVGEFQVRFFDYDGTLLKSARVNSGDGVAPPANPSHAGLTFQGWNRSDYTNITSDLDIGAMYITTDGKTRLKLIITDRLVGVNITFYLGRNETGTLYIDFGDGSTIYSNTGSTTASPTHAYSVAGTYDVKVWSTNTYSIGGGNTPNTPVVYGSTQEIRDCLVEINVGEKVTTISKGAIYNSFKLKYLTLPKSVTSFGGAFSYNYALQTLIIPELCTNFGTSIGVLVYCYGLKNIILPAGAYKLELSQFFYSSNLSDTVIPPNITSLSSECFYGAKIKKIYLPFLTNVATKAFIACTILEEVKFGSQLKTIEAQAFYSCQMLRYIDVPSSVTYIGDSAFGYAYALEYLIFRSTTPPIITTATFNNMPATTKIYVPDALVDTYKTATNWSTYANYIYPLSSLT